MTSAGGTDELSRAQQRLIAAENRLDAAQEKVTEAVAAEAEDEHRVAKAELGVAKARLGVAEAKVGVAEAKWQAGSQEDKAQLWALVESAQTAVQDLRAAAPHHGIEEQFRQWTLRIEQKIDEQGQKTVEHGQSLATIHENQVLLQDSIGAVKDAVSTVKSTVDGWRDQCKMSAATKGKHFNIFHFNVLEEDPPMVDELDTRIRNLVEKLQGCRQAEGFDRTNESDCRTHAVDVFFQEVATVLESEIVKSTTAGRLLTVRVAQTEFSGFTDVLIGQGSTLPLLAVEVKPLKGNQSLKGNGFDSELFGHKTQIVLQCAAVQAQCSEAPGLYSCLLTNLESLYMVQVTSYDANTIHSRAFRVVQDATKFVRAVLRVADDNRGLAKETSCMPLICEAAQGFDSNRRDPTTHGGIQQILRAAGARADEPQGGEMERGGGHNPGARMTAEQAEWSFERLLPTVSQQKSDVRPNLTRAWVRLCSRDYFQDLSSFANVSSSGAAFE
uniref:Uncharacterized protein n=1 Tax=Hemiselmis andersenii TaxID=464988 RepID=A0A7S1DLQ0_HEMAN|mmetsp:Transcript_18037/g.43396  ORF Transcript_18037/g.43396 Transcript_18037/m.43396 type:complete len:499 (+) Transcript_18037:202-1698(+)